WPSGEAGPIAWLEGWDAHTQAYLAQPAAADTVNGIVRHLADCPTPLAAELIEMIAELLAQLPELPADDAAASPTDAGQADESPDMSLSTDQLDPQLLASLLADAPEQLQHVGAVIAQCADGRRPDASVLLEAQRVSHTLKGSALIVG